LSLIQDKYKNTKHRLPLFTEEYQFIIPKSERERLCLTTEVLPRDIKLNESDIRELQLVRRQYADAPSVYATAPPYGAAYDGHDADYRMRGNSAAIHIEVGDSTASARLFSPDDFIFNDTTAALYEQWNVIKTNKRGTNQNRIFGIDYQKIYNKKQERDIGKGMLHKHSVKRSERHFTDVARFGINEEDPSIVEIWWKEHGTGKEPDAPLKYKVDSEDGQQQAAYIVAKIGYIIEQRKKSLL
jgi:hypothetical protein